MKRYRKRTPIVEAVEWTGDNVDEIKEFCPNSIIDDRGRLWIPAHLTMYCVPGPCFIVKNPDAKWYHHRAVNPDPFNETFEEVD